MIHKHKLDAQYAFLALVLLNHVGLLQACRFVWKTSRIRQLAQEVRAS
jgi:hypothetical protein